MVVTSKLNWVRDVCMSIFVLLKACTDVIQNQRKTVPICVTVR